MGSSDVHKPLLSLGKLYQGTVLRRPSKHNKSPYVADVKLDDGGNEVIAHAPMLDLGGLIRPGTVVRMKESKPGGKTSHSIQLVGVNEFLQYRLQNNGRGFNTMDQAGFTTS